MSELAPNGLPTALRDYAEVERGCDNYSPEATAVMDAAADEIDRLRAELSAPATRQMIDAALKEQINFMEHGRFAAMEAAINAALKARAILTSTAQEDPCQPQD